MKKLLLTIAIILPLAGVAQQNDKGTALPIIRTNEKALPIFEDGAGKPTGWWIINPKIRPDVYETSAKKLFFMNEKRDTLAFNIERGGMYDFIILQNGCDTATATDDTATLSTDLATGDIAIVKIGKHSIKVASSKLTHTHTHATGRSHRCVPCCIYTPPCRASNVFKK